MLYESDGRLRDAADLAPLTVSSQMRLARVAFLLRSVGAAACCVVDEGRLVGVVTTPDLANVEQRAPPPLDRSSTVVAATPFH